MNTNTQLKQLSNLNHLLAFSSDDLLDAFIRKYNEQNELIDQQATQINLLSTQLEGYKRQVGTQNDEIKKLNEENVLCRTLAKEAEKIAKHSIGLQTELDRTKRINQQLSKDLAELKQLNPKRLKEQNKRQQAKAAEKEKRIEQLEKALKDAGAALQNERADHQKAFGKIAELRSKLALEIGSGLYHNKEHHLIVWPQLTTMLDENGNKFKGQSLLYLHQSGRGGLIAYNPSTEQISLCAQPKGGLRLSAEVKEFAAQWLYKVNVLQDGVTREEDMIPVNYNGEDFL
ncbi:hypothetical protein LCX39_004082 [Vibrio vulnificus]|uniref:hypothetical protein n=1 Tax=Vibrio vulnificus TaxID=672 RepID=UPI001A1A57EC|nr:hypothetical protein [Vibrio vulnificus]EIE1227673.1 hypothetical protein [Vibrio vulnificus]